MQPQANGQTKVTNRTIVKRIKTKLNGAVGLWSEELHNVLWAYRTMTRRATGETPFSLVYGMEEVIPPKMDIGMDWVWSFVVEENNESR